MELRKLTIRDRKIITELFCDVFTNEPWNDDWSDTEQLTAYNLRPDRAVLFPDAGIL